VVTEQPVLESTCNNNQSKKLIASNYIAVLSIICPSACDTFGTENEPYEILALASVSGAGKISL
jgi:hypothetical protein